MKMSTTRIIFTALLAVLVFVLAPVAFGQTSPGQSRTLLPDGRILLLGGFDSHDAPMPAAFIATSMTGAAQKLASGLNIPRAGHTATVLPDGTVLIFGGVGVDGKVVKSAELFDPSTNQFAPLADVLAVPRAFHTATLLTDGTLLLAGGVMAGGQFPADVQLWDWRTRKALSFEASLLTPREGHKAVLLSDGEVRISGGTDRFGQPVSVDEIFDPVTKRVRFVTQSEADDSLQAFAMAASIPEDGAAAVPVQDPIALRFTRLLNVAGASQGEFVLTAPDQPVVQARITAAERGRLVFVVPVAPLQPGTVYVLTIKGAADTSGNALPESLITFTTEGEPAEGNSLDWIPNTTWSYSGGTTRFQAMPPLQARAGTTALAGQVLKLNGWPLEHVTLEMNGSKVRTDATGRFLLTGLTAGHNVLWIDGSTANRDDASYGVYEVGVTILPNKTNVLNYTIWMTRLDMVHAVTIPSPITTETVITNPLLPGLELHLPAGTVITDRHGKVTRQVSITPVPLNKPPFPLPPGVQVPIYFTIQPGGAYISVAKGWKGPAGARLFYPNAFHLPPNTPFEFWNYDADAKGWFIYGLGRVSASGLNVVPDPGVLIYEFTGAMVGVPGGAGIQACLAGHCPKRSDPVSLQTGQFVHTKTDLYLPDMIPLSFTRTYITNDSHSRSFGIGATDSYDIFMIGDTNPYTYQELVLPNGARIRFDRVSAGTDYTNAVYVHVSSQDPFYGAVLSRDVNANFPGTWKLLLKDGTVYRFPEAFQQTNTFCQAVVYIADRYGNQVTLNRIPSGTNVCQLAKIISPSGRYIGFTEDSAGRITQAQDSMGRTVSYAYDSGGRLATVTDAGGGVTTYTYDDSNRMLTIKDPRGIVYLANQYDSSGRVIEQTQADGGVYQFAWTPTANTTQTHFIRSVGGGGGGGGGGVIMRDSGCWDGVRYDRYNGSCGEGYMPLVAQVDVTDPRGYVERVVFNGSGYPTSDTRALGQPNQQSVTYAYYTDNTLQSLTDALGRVTSFDFDAYGNPTRVTRLDGTSNAVTTTLSYEPYFNQLASVTDPLGHTSTLSYDALGNLTTATDPLNHQTTFAHNGFGQLTSITDALNNRVQFGYFGGDLVSVTDPLSNQSTNNYDNAGRVIASLDAQGNTTSYQYSSLNLMTQVTDAKGNNTSFAYDPNGNLLSLTDALNHTTSWTYDSMDRPLTRTDPLLRQESYTYDLNGNLASSTDRKGQVTSVTYDALNRATLVGYNTIVNGGNTTYESTIAYTYDAGNRMTQVVDSAGGTITEAYDDLDRLTTETTAQGSVSYGYDNVGRRTSMTVAGQPQVNYTYDNGSRLTQIAQGSSSVGFAYDNIDRRSSLTLPNGVSVSYSYDNDSHVTGITYNFGGNTLGNLTYTNDSLGRRTQVGGSFARTGLPGAVASATYDAANELTNWNGTAISYDANGNMQSDGTNAFTWNARNQVATLNSVNLQYDALGRRIKNAAATSFLYDGPNATEELSGTTVTANVWTGGLDEIFQRTDTSGTVVPITDALGSVLALADSNGNLVTQYSYDPFGNTTVSGTASSNPSQYTGRENEGNGLYFLRARYYSPALHRFIREDPLRFAGSGANFYAYAFNSPTNLVDRTGLAPGAWWDPRTYKTLPSELNPFNPNGTFSQEAIAIGQSATGIVTGNWAQVAAAADNTPLGMTAMYGRSCDPFAKYVGYYGTRGALAGAALADMLAGALMVPELFDDMPQVDPNKLAHIFDNPAHNLGPVVNAMGGEANAFNAIEGAVQAQGLADGLFTTVVNVGGSNVTVTGIVINGVARIGTAFIP